MDVLLKPAAYSLPVGRHSPGNSASRSLSISAITSHSIADRTKWGSQNRMFILGIGYVGQFFAYNLKKEGWVVTGTSTSAIRKNELETRGFDVCLFDGNESRLLLSTLGAMKCYTHLLVSIPPVAGIGDSVLQHGELLRSILSDGNLRWIGYLSSTSVYGECGGAWVDEDYPPNPTSTVSKSRLAAEEGWLNLGTSLGLPTQAFRLGGIYGPGRRLWLSTMYSSLCACQLFAIDTITKQEALSKNQKMRTSKQYTSRIHIEDICQALKASICKPSFRIYNIVDDDPAPREEVFAYAEELVGKKWPEWAQAQQRRWLLENTPSYNKRGEKRVCNGRLKRELGVKLLYPSYRSGLLSIIDKMDNPL